MSLVRLAVCLLLIGMVTSTVQGQERDRSGEVRDTVVARVAKAFNHGDAELLLTPAAERVEVSLFGTQSFYSSSQSFYVLRHFFEAHPPSSFTLEDTTASGTSYFVQGNFRDGREDRLLQVYVRLVRGEGDAWRLHEVRIGPGAE